MRTYLDLLDDVLANGDVRMDRTGVGTRSLFARTIRHDLSEGFPLLTTKRVHMRSVAVELAWFLRGRTDVGWLNDHGVSIWDEWADADGDLGPVYGRQWRSWPAPDGGTVDQIARAADGLRSDPNGRRHLVVAWNPGEIDRMALPPCHCLFQFHVAGGRLSCQVYQRSADVFLGLPFNVASYALLTHLVAGEVGLGTGKYVHVLGDVHLYANHVDQAREQLRRAPRALPRLDASALRGGLDAFDPGSVRLVDYDPHPTIRAPVAV